jgi:outer membrane protein TolC
MNSLISHLILKSNKLPSMRRILILALLIFLIASPVTAQHYSNTPSNLPAYRPSKDTVKIMDIREKLVQLAMQNPSFEIADRQLNKSVYELRKAKSAWLSPVSGQINVNEVSINQPIGGPVVQGATLYPRWNVGLMIPLDFFAARKNEIKIARENLLISEAEKNHRYRQIRAEVLTAYEDYLMYKEMLDIQSRITQDQQTTLKTREKDYEDGLINGEEYNKYYATYSGEKIKLAEAVRNLNAAKIALEAMIGVPLEKALSTK